MLEIKMNDVRRQQAPQLPGRQPRAVISQQGPASIPPELRQEEHGTGEQQSETVLAVAIERREHSSEGLHRPQAVHLLSSRPACNRGYAPHHGRFTGTFSS